jgi:hypothetical protein
MLEARPETGRGITYRQRQDRSINASAATLRLDLAPPFIPEAPLVALAPWACFFRLTQPRPAALPP